MKVKNMPGRKALRKFNAGSGTFEQYEAAMLLRSKKNRSSKKNKVILIGSTNN